MRQHKMLKNHLEPYRKFIILIKVEQEGKKIQQKYLSKKYKEKKNNCKEK